MGQRRCNAHRRRRRALKDEQHGVPVSELGYLPNIQPEPPDIQPEPTDQLYQFGGRSSRCGTSFLAGKSGIPLVRDHGSFIFCARSSQRNRGRAKNLTAMTPHLLHVFLSFPRGRDAAADSSAS